MRRVQQVRTSGNARDSGSSSASSYRTALTSLASWRGSGGIWGPVVDLSRVIDEQELRSLRKIGGGGYADVYKLDHPFFGEIALKRVHEAGETNVYTEERRRARLEAILWQSLRHPNVLTFFGIFESNLHYFLISEFAPNGTISTFTKEHPQVDRLELLAQAADGLAYLHENRIVHGDVKGANVLISGDARALVCDFGLAKAFESITSTHRHGAGSTRWMSPEVLNGQGRTPESDVWSYGMMTVEVLSGNIPYAGISPDTRVIIAILHDKVRPLKVPIASEGGLSYQFAWSFAEGCWDEDPSQRPNIGLARKALKAALILLQHKTMISTVAFSPNSSFFASASSDCTVHLWDVAQAITLSEPIKEHTKTVRSVAFSPDGTTLCSGSDDKTVRLWDIVTGRTLGEPLRGHTSYVSHVAFSPDGRIIVSGSYDKTIRVWDSVSRSCIAVLKGHIERVTSVAFSPDGETLVSGSGDGTVRLWDMTTHAEIGNLMKEHSYWVQSVAFSPDGSTIASGSVDRTVRLWDARTHLPKGFPLAGHTCSVLSVTFCPNGRLLASGSLDHTIRIWDLTATPPTTKLELRDHTDLVWSVVFSPDGKWLASGSLDKTVRLWDLDVLLGTV